MTTAHRFIALAALLLPCSAASAQIVTFDFENSTGPILDTGFASLLTQTIGDLEISLSSANFIQRPDGNGVTNSFVFNQFDEVDSGNNLFNFAITLNNVGAEPATGIAFNLVSIDFSNVGDDTLFDTDETNDGTGGIVTTVTGEFLEAGVDAENSDDIFVATFSGTTGNGLDLFETVDTDDLGSPLSANSVNAIGISHLNLNPGVAGDPSFDFPAIDNIVISLDGPVGPDPGDFNDDGVVDVDDFVLARDGGPNTSGDVAADVGAVIANFTGPATPGAVASATAVPEPSALLLLLSSTALACGRSRRRSA